jgi:hypothetical protein
MFAELSINPFYKNLAVTDLWLVPGSDQHKQWLKDKCTEAWGNKVVVSTFKLVGSLELAEVYDTDILGNLQDLVFMAIVHNC